MRYPIRWNVATTTYGQPRREATATHVIGFSARRRFSSIASDMIAPGSANASTIDTMPPTTGPSQISAAMLIRRNPSGRSPTRWQIASTRIVVSDAGCAGYSEISRRRFQNGTISSARTFLVGCESIGCDSMSALRNRSEHAAQDRAAELAASIAHDRFRHRFKHALAAARAEDHVLRHAGPAALLRGALAAGRGRILGRRRRCRRLRALGQYLERRFAIDRRVVLAADRRACAHRRALVRRDRADAAAGRGDQR